MRAAGEMAGVPCASGRPRTRLGWRAVAAEFRVDERGDVGARSGLGIAGEQAADIRADVDGDRLVGSGGHDTGAATKERKQDQRPRPAFLAPAGQQALTHSNTADRGGSRRRGARAAGFLSSNGLGGHWPPPLRLRMFCTAFGTGVPR